MKRLLVLTLCGAVGLGAFSAGFEGLAGRELAQAVAREYAQHQGVGPQQLGVWFDNGDAVVELAPGSWWGEDAPTDFYNLVSGSADFHRERSDYPPGELTVTTATGRGWAVGTAEISGVKTNLWQTDDDRRGDLARRLMYMAVMYPTELWRGRGAMLFADGDWPLLSGYGKRLLMSWHRADPVSDTEREECRAIALAQGNENPFVARPDLAEYLWGEHEGQGYINPEHRDRVPLKPSYSLAADKFVDLYSPYVAEDSQWKIDGKAVEGESIPTADLGVGVHELTFTNSAASGSLKITIMP